MCRLLLMTIACLLILFGISGLWMMPRLIQQKIEQRMQLKINTKPYERFTKIPIPLTVKFYLFNVTNSEQVLAGLEVPQFQEVGPFMYKQWRRRDIIDFEDNNRRLVYREYKTYYSMFDRSSSNTTATTGRHNSTSTVDNNTTSTRTSSPHMLDPHNTSVTIINVPLLSVLTKLAQLEEGSFKRNLAAKVATRLIADGRDKILTTRPVDQLLFDGYKVPFMESARDLVSEILGFNFESPLPNNMFGFLYGKNGTWSKREGGELTVFTGRNDSMNDFMLVDKWNNLKELNVWPTNTEAGNRCNQIKGTDGSQFHPGVTKHQVLSIFSPMVCRSLFIKYKEDTQTKDIPLLRFSTPPELFAAPKKNPQNACYCTIQSSEPINQRTSITSYQSIMSQQKINNSRCYLDGLMDLSLCQRGAPIAASSPHFYNADPMLAMAAGLKPNKAQHETYIDIEPMTGAVFRAASRAQINAYVEQAALDVVDSSIIGNMTHMVAPLFWLEEAAEIDEKSSNEFKGQLLNIVQKAKRTFIYSIIIGIILGLSVGIQYWYITCYSIDTKECKSKVETKNVHGGGGKLRAARARVQLETQMRSNKRPRTGARRANQAAKHEPLLDDVGDEPLPSSSSNTVPVIAFTSALVGAGAGTNARRARQRGKRQRQANYENCDEKELSKKMLVGEEWDFAAATSSSGRSSHSVDNGARGGHPAQSDSEGDDSVIDDQRQESDKDEDIDLNKPGTSSAGSA